MQLPESLIQISDERLPLKLDGKSVLRITLRLRLQSPYCPNAVTSLCGVRVYVLLSGNLFFEQAESLRGLLYSHDAVDVFLLDNF